MLKVMPLQDQRLEYVVVTRKFLELLRPGTDEARKAALGRQLCIAYICCLMTSFSSGGSKPLAD